MQQLIWNSLCCLGEQRKHVFLSYKRRMESYPTIPVLCLVSTMPTNEMRNSIEFLTQMGNCYCRWLKREKRTVSLFQDR
jgi:hypothetical protein